MSPPRVSRPRLTRALAQLWGLGAQRALQRLLETELVGKEEWLGLQWLVA